MKLLKKCIYDIYSDEIFELLTIINGERVLVLFYLQDNAVKKHIKSENL